MKHRKLKTFLLIACIPILLAVFYVLLDFKPMPFVAQYRLAEKAAMVGPAKILGITRIKPDPQNKATHYDLLVARTEHGVILYDGNLVYQKDLGYGTIFLAAPSDKSTSHPLVVFDKYPEAVRAELKITVTEAICSSYSNVGKSVTAEAVREQDGYFVFFVKTGDAIDRRKLANFSAGSSNYIAPIPVHLKLYDKDGKIVISYILKMLSPGIIAHREQTGTDIE